MANDELELHSEELLGHPEEWEVWETKLVGYSIALGIVGLAILGWLINTFLLTGDHPLW